MNRTACSTTLPHQRNLDPELSGILDWMATGVARLATIIATPNNRHAGTTSSSPSGDIQVELDMIAHDLFIDIARQAGIGIVASEEAELPAVIGPGRFDLAIDPLDGSSNVDINAPIGTIFSIIDSAGCDRDDVTDSFLRDGSRIVASGVSVYGPQTSLVIAAGDTTTIYQLMPGTDHFETAIESAEVPREAREFAINMSNRRHWPATIRRYVDDLLAGSTGPRGADFNMRWNAALVAEMYRILRRGGIYLYPADSRPGYEEGRLRLLYEGHPIAHLIETAGGAATDGARRLLDVAVTDLHQRTPLVFGSETKVSTVSEYWAERGFRRRSPLFADRGLLRD